MSRKIDRRDFIKSGSAAIAGLGLLTTATYGAARLAQKKSVVIEVTHPKAVGENRQIDETAVRAMLRKGMKTLNGSDRPWAKFIQPNDVVGLKINTLGRPLIYTHHELIAAVVAELVAVGVKENNIIVWDRFEDQMKACNFTMKRGESGVQCFASEGPDGSTMLYDDQLVYTSDADDAGRRDRTLGNRSLFSSVFTKDCDKIINMAILKDHALSGVTLCLKNLAYGLTTNNARFHGPSHINPFIADICAYDQVRRKVVLHLVDGLEGCYDNGPLPRNPNMLFAPQTLWLGTDPVALDAVGRAVLEAERKQRGLPTLAASGRPADHIELAAKKGLGVGDLSQINIKKVPLTA